MLQVRKEGEGEEDKKDLEPITRERNILILNILKFEAVLVFFQAAPAPAPRSQKHLAPTGSGSGSPAMDNIITFLLFFR